MIYKDLAILNLRPNTQWSMIEGDVENITWYTPNTQPLTEEEVQVEMIRLQQEEESKAQAKQEKLQSAKAKLAALGLDEDEINAILGGI
jgi:hypothetical protein